MADTLVAPGNPSIAIPTNLGGNLERHDLYANADLSRPNGNALI